MALIKCEECGGMVSDKATQCPHCGCPLEPVETEEVLTPDERMDEMPNVKLWVTVAIVAFVVIGSILTCPGADKHREAVNEVCSEAMAKYAADEADNPFASTVALVGGNIVGNVVSRFVTVDNYVVFSMGAIKVPGQKKRIVSIGAFGHVFTFVSADDIYNKVNHD